MQRVYDLGLRAEAFAPRPRAVETVDAAAGVLCITNSGLYADAPLFRFQVDGSAVPGKPSAGLPLGLSASVMYLAVPVSGSDDLFQVKPYGGSLLTSFGDAGSGVFSVRAQVSSTIQIIAESESAYIDNGMTAHSAPFTIDPATGRYPDILEQVCAQRTAIRAALVMGTSSAAWADSLKLLIAAKADIDARFKEWLAGRAILPTPLDQTPMLAENSAIAANDAAPVNWRTGTL